NVGRNVLLIARHLGMLSPAVGPPDSPIRKFLYPLRESLRRWIKLADEIQDTFHLRHRTTEKSFDSYAGKLNIVLCYRSDEPPSLQIRPFTTYDALLYHAAQMIARGSTLQVCDKCAKPFLGGGGGRSSRAKRRGDARFCGDRCRWEYHNEVRRRKAKL